MVALVQCHKHEKELLMLKNGIGQVRPSAEDKPFQKLESEQYVYY